MRVRRQVTDIPNANPIVGVAARLKSHADGSTLATMTTDAEGFYDFQRDGNPGECFVEILDGATPYYHSAKASAPAGAASPLELPYPLLALKTGVIPGVGGMFAVTATGGLGISVASGAGLVGAALPEAGYTENVRGARPVVSYAPTLLTLPANSTRFVQWVVNYGSNGHTAAIRDRDTLFAGGIPLATVVTDSAGVVSIADTRAWFMAGQLQRNPTLFAATRVGSALGLSNTSGVELPEYQASVGPLLSGVTYDVEAIADVIASASAGSIAVYIDGTGNLSAYLGNGAAATTLLSNTHARTVVGGGVSIGCGLFARDDDPGAPTFEINRGVLSVVAVPRL